jgi:dTDP-4-amino-4,6-dideoxygalactose transaminase
VYHLYVIRTKDREGLKNFLHKAGIGTGIHYPIPLHLQKAYASLTYARGDFPVAETASAEILSLPMFPHLTAEQQARVADQVQLFTSQCEDADLAAKSSSPELAQMMP